MNKIVSAFLVLITLVSQFAGSQAIAATSATSLAKQVVIQQISISQRSGEDLDFGSAVQGAAALTVDPASPAAGTIPAGFDVSGAASQAYSVSLPSSVTLTTAGGGVNKEIVVDTFSFISTNGSTSAGALDGSGADVLKVGAKRAALGASQVAGSYSGTFTVTVAY